MLRTALTLTGEHKFQPQSEAAVPLQTQQPRNRDSNKAGNKYRRRSLLLHVGVPRAIPLQVAVTHALVVDAPTQPKQHVSDNKANGGIRLFLQI